MTYLMIKVDCIFTVQYLHVISSIFFPMSPVCHSLNIFILLFVANFTFFFSLLFPLHMVSAYLIIALASCHSFIYLTCNIWKLFRLLRYLKGLCCLRKHTYCFMPDKAHLGFQVLRNLQFHA